MKKEEFYISPQILKEITKGANSMAKDMLETAKRQLGGGFPPGKRIAIRRIVRIDQTYEIEESKRAFAILKRYFRMRYRRVEYKEHTDGFEMYFDIYIKTPERDPGICRNSLGNYENRRY